MTSTSTPKESESSFGDVENQHLLEGEFEIPVQKTALRTSIPLSPLSYMLHLFLLSISFGLFVLAARRYTYSDRAVSVLDVDLFDDLIRDVRVERRQLQGNFGRTSIFIGEPNHELDEAWDRISFGGVFGLQSKEMAQLHKSTEATAKFSSSQGGGYMASLEVFHQLHCLNIVRKFTYRDHYEHEPMFHATPEDKVIEHKDHCIDVLREFIMCAGDVVPITYYWVDGREDPMPDFNTTHSCRNFEDIQTWVEARMKQG